MLVLVGTGRRCARRRQERQFQGAGSTAGIFRLDASANAVVGKTEGVPSGDVLAICESTSRACPAYVTVEAGMFVAALQAPSTLVDLDLLVAKLCASAVDFSKLM